MILNDRDLVFAIMLLIAVVAIIAMYLLNNDANKKILKLLENNDSGDSEMLKLREELAKYKYVSDRLFTANKIISRKVSLFEKDACYNCNGCTHWYQPVTRIEGRSRHMFLMNISAHLDKGYSLGQLQIVVDADLVTVANKTEVVCNHKPIVIKTKSSPLSNDDSLSNGSGLW